MEGQMCGRSTTELGYALVLAVALMLTAAACGGSGGGGGDGGSGGGGPVVPGTTSCTATQTVNSGGQILTMKICSESTGVSPQQVEALRLACGMGTIGAGGGVDASQDRVFAQAPCSHDGALGACALTILAGMIQTSWYYDDDTGITQEMIQMLCAQIGATFVSP
jgi:hypothetical protein